MKLQDIARFIRGRRTFVVLIVALPVVLLGGACGSDGESGAGTLSCKIDDTGNIPGTDSCTDYAGVSAVTVMQLCSIPGAQYAPSACASANRIGGCRGTFGAGRYTRWYYPRSDAATPATTADVMADCTSLTPAETFTPP